MVHDINTWRTITLSFAATGQTLFVLLYFTFPWFTSFLGRALFYKALMLAVLLDLAVLSRFFKFGAQDDVFVVLYALLGLGVWFQFLAFLREKRAAHEREALS